MPVTRAWRWYVAASALLSVAYFLAPLEPAKLVIWPLIGCSSVAAILVGIRVHQPEPRLAFSLIAAGVATLITGDFLYSVGTLVLDLEPSTPSSIDVIYLAMYPLLIGGVILIDQRRMAGRDRAGAIDTAIVTVSVALVAWVVLISPAFRLDEPSLLERLGAIAYPVGDVALFAAVARLAARGQRKSPVPWVMAFGVAPLLVADAIYGYVNLTGDWHEHHVADLGWIMFYVGCGASALHPAVASVATPTNAGREVTPLRVVLVASAVVVAPLTLLLDSADGEVEHVVPIAVASGLLFVLVIVRVAGLVGTLAAARAQDRFRALLLHASDAMVVLDGEGRVIFATPSTERVLGHDVAGLPGRAFAELLGPADREQLAVMLVDRAETTTVEWTIGRDDERPRPLEVVVTDTSGFSTAAGVVLTLRDITERKRLHEELRRQALHDTLTDLPHRTLFLDRLQQALERATRTGAAVTVLLLDIDDFKAVNERFGYAAGDHVLAAVGARLRTAVEVGVTVARLGADEFALLLDDADEAEVDQTAAAVQAAFAAPFATGREDAHHVNLRISMGAATGVSTLVPNDLLRNADLALFVAKRGGANRFVRYEGGMHEEARRRVEIATELAEAIEHNDLAVHFQPIVDVHTGRFVGAEALVRWRDRAGGLRLPADFIPIAETSGSIIPLGRWVLDEACQTVADMKRSGVADERFYVTVNVSAHHVQDPTLIADVRHALTTAGLDGAALVLEVTETTLIEDIHPAGSALAALKELGLRIAVDDFGTGYSSLAYLSEFPLDIMKIDKSFVDRMTTSADGETMARALVDLARTLGLAAVAEGVEQPEQAEMLARFGCPLAQGYVFARPMPSDELAAALERQRIPAR